MAQCYVPDERISAALGDKGNAMTWKVLTTALSLLDGVSQDECSAEYVRALDELVADLCGIDHEQKPVSTAKLWA